MIDQAEAVIRQAHGGEVLTRQLDEGPQAAGLLPSPPLPQPAVAAELGGLVGMPSPVTAAISRATLGSAPGVYNNASGMIGLKVAHAMPLHIGAGEMVQQHKAPAPPRWTSAVHRGPACPSLAFSAVPVAAPAPAPSAISAPGNHEDGAGIERQEPNVPVGPPDELSGPQSEAKAARQQVEEILGEMKPLPQVEAGQQAAAKRPAVKPPLTSEEARRQARAEGLTLLVSNSGYNSMTGYFGVSLKQPGKPKPYLAQVRRGGKQVFLGMFATAEEAALCVARSPEGRKAARQAAAPPPMTSEEARQQARAEGLTLLVADNKAGYFGVCHRTGKVSKPYQAMVTRAGEQVYLGYFVTAEEAALCVARSPEGQEAAIRRESRTAMKRPAAAAALASEEEARYVSHVAAAKVKKCNAGEDDVLAAKEALAFFGGQLPASSF